MLEIVVRYEKLLFNGLRINNFMSQVWPLTCWPHQYFVVKNLPVSVQPYV